MSWATATTHTKAIHFGHHFGAAVGIFGFNGLARLHSSNFDGLRNAMGRKFHNDSFELD